MEVRFTPRYNAVSSLIKLAAEVTCITRTRFLRQGSVSRFRRIRWISSQYLGASSEKQNVGREDPDALKPDNGDINHERSLPDMKYDGTATATLNRQDKSGKRVRWSWVRLTALRAHQCSP